MSRKKRFENIARIDINIVSLEDNIFCSAKSELKFIEAGILKIPTIAFANQTFSSIITNGFNGFVAKNTKEWTKNLQLLINDKKLRKKCGKNAYKIILDKYTTESCNIEYINLLNDLLNK